MRYTDDGILQLEASDIRNVTNASTTVQIYGVSHLLEYLNDILREEQLKWPVIYGQLELRDHVWNTKNPEWHDTHVSRLMPPRPIQKDSLEALVKDLVNAVPVDMIGISWINRAKKLLEGEKK